MIINETIHKFNDIGVTLIKSGHFHNFAGLITNNLELGKYECTPLNTHLFAFSGGDGVHFSYLEINNEISPIIMTVPATAGKSADEYNLIIAETFDELLGLGYYNGWSGLDGYFYYPNQTLFEYGDNQVEYGFSNQNEIIFLNEVISQFCVKPVFLDEDRLKYLKEKYFTFLEFDPEFFNFIFLI